MTTAESEALLGLYTKLSSPIFHDLSPDQRKVKSAVSRMGRTSPIKLVTQKFLDSTVPESLLGNPKYDLGPVVLGRMKPTIDERGTLLLQRINASVHLYVYALSPEELIPVHVRDVLSSDGKLVQVKRAQHTLREGLIGRMEVIKRVGTPRFARLSATFSETKDSSIVIGETLGEWLDGIRKEPTTEPTQEQLAA